MGPGPCSHLASMSSLAMDDAIDSVYLSLVMVTPLSLATRQIIVRCAVESVYLSRFLAVIYS